MKTETFNILLIDLERVVRRLTDIDVLNAHLGSTMSRNERLELARMDAEDIESCASELEDILDVAKQLAK